MANQRRTGIVGSNLAAVIVMLFAVAIWPSGGATAQEGSSRTLTLLTARCPANYIGTASADECDNAPMPGVAFRVGRPYTDFFMTAYTDAAGLVVFDITDLPLHGTIRLIEELPPRTARIVVYCVDQAGTPLPVTYVPMHGNVPPVMVADLAVGETGDVFCDWYNVALE
jgi:hypothetical protein